MTPHPKFLIDAGLPRIAAERLRGLGIDAVGAHEAGLLDAADDAVTAHATAAARVLVTRRPAAGAIERPPSFPGILLLSLPPSSSDAEACDALAELVFQYLSASIPFVEKP